MLQLDVAEVNVCFSMSPLKYTDKSYWGTFHSVQSEGGSPHRLMKTVS